MSGMPTKLRVPCLAFVYSKYTEWKELHHVHSPDQTGLAICCNLRGVDEPKKESNSSVYLVEAVATRSRAVVHRPLFPTPLSWNCSDRAIEGSKRGSTPRHSYCVYRHGLAGRDFSVVNGLQSICPCTQSSSYPSSIAVAQVGSRVDYWVQQ
ncbi:hypothetical protein BJX70DRAFT_376800 [Aspergillus crustosus]